MTITRIQLRRGTAAQWTAMDPVLAQGEVGVETDTDKFKIGDGTTAWIALEYAAGAGGTAGVASFNTRTGAVGLTKADVTGTGLTAADVGADASGAAAAAQNASLQKSANLSDLVNVATARTSLGLGSAATQNTSAFDPAGAAAAVEGLPLGLAGATAATRYVGGTASGAPTSGTFVVGDFVVDQTGKAWICTTAGTPGTWIQAGGVSSFNTRSGAVTLSKADVTGTGLAAADVGADASGAAAAVQAASLQKASNLADVADVDSSRASIRVPVLRECRVVATANIAALSGTTTIDGVALAAGDRVLLTAQTTGSQNGPWLVQTGAWTRPNDYPAAGVLTSRLCSVPGGSAANQGIWQLKSTVAITVDTTATTWALSGGASSGPITENAQQGFSTVATGESFFPVPYIPGQRYGTPEGDTLCLARFQNEADVLSLAPGGGARLIANTATYFGTTQDGTLAVPHGDLTSASTAVANLTGGLPVGAVYGVTGTGVPASTTLTVTGTGTTGTLSNAATATNVNVTLTINLQTTGGALTVLPVVARANTLPPGTVVTLTQGANVQSWVLTAQANVNDTTLAVESQTPNFNYTSAATVTFPTRTFAAPLVPGPGAGFSQAVGPAPGVSPAGAIPCLWLPVDGTTPTDQWTIEFYIKSVGADYTAQPTVVTQYFLHHSVNNNSQLLQVYRNATANALNVFLAGPGGTSVAVITIGSIPAGAIPADAWTPITVTLNNGTLFAAIGANASGALTGSTTLAASVGLLLPWSNAEGSGNGLKVNYTTSGQAGRPFNVTAPHIRRYTRTINAAPTTTLLKRATIAVNANGTQGAALDKLGGAFNQYAGWRGITADCVSPTYAPGTAVRNAINNQQAADGLSIVRVDHIFDKAVTGQPGTVSAAGVAAGSVSAIPLTSAIVGSYAVGDTIILQNGTTTDYFVVSSPVSSGTSIPVSAKTITNSYPSGAAVIGINWANVDDQWNSIKAAGLIAHLTMGYTPTPLLGAAVNTPPIFGGSNANGNAIYATMVVAALAHANALGLKVWPYPSERNEPDAGANWNGTFTQYAAMWAAEQAAVAASGLTNYQGVAYAMGGAEGSNCQAGSTFGAQLLAYCHTNSLPLPAIYIHDYSGNLYALRYMLQQNWANLATNAFLTYQVLTLHKTTGVSGTTVLGFTWNGVAYTAPAIANGATAYQVIAALQQATGPNGELLPPNAFTATGGVYGTTDVVITAEGAMLGPMTALTATNITGDIQATLTSTTAGVAPSTLLCLTEWNIDVANTGVFGTTTGDISQLWSPDVTNHPVHAAFVGSYLCELRNGGVAMAAFTRQGVIDLASYGGATGAFEGLVSPDALPRPKAAYAALQAWWRMTGGSEIPCSTNDPRVRAKAVKFPTGKIVIFYCTYRPLNWTQRDSFSLEITGLPALFTWKREHAGQSFQVGDYSTAASPDERGPDYRLRLVAQGTQANFLTGLGASHADVGAITITPS